MPVRVALMVLIVEPLEIVVPGSLQKCRAALSALPGDIVRADGDKGVVTVIVQAHFIPQFPRDNEPPFRVRVVDLVADAPENDRRAVAIPADPRGDIRLPVITEEGRVVVVCLVEFPHVKCFRIHKNTELVAQIHELDGGHVVRSADGVHAHGEQRKELPLRCGFVDGCAERAEVVVHACAVKLQPPAVQEEAAVRVKPDGAEADSLRDCVHRAQFLHVLRGNQKSACKLVEIWIVCIPGVSVLHRECLRVASPDEHGCRFGYSSVSRKNDCF